MAIHYYGENIKKPRLRYRLISNWLKFILQQNCKSPGDISIIFCDDKYLLEINNRYLHHKYFTDIITFDYVEGMIVSGDIFISTERVADNSVKFGVNLEDEFLRVIAHGVLHLLGYTDVDRIEKELMRNKESEYIALYKNFKDDGSFKI